ncbi:MAG: hypothetical protein GY795_44865 [Desulfobacterales bacterium]|nr:hypothetical protein [Desulfobacterales bacterium]
MILLDVPFIPDNQYVQFLNSNAEKIYSVHFSLYSDVVPDARYKFRLLEPRDIIRHLEKIKVPKKYVLMNSRFHLPSDYLDSDHLNIVLDKLALMSDASVLDGIIYTDQYYLGALSGTGRKVCSQLEAVPSVNCIIDSFDKAVSFLSAVSCTNFRMPGKLVLDRSLNRKIRELSDIVQKCRTEYPEIKLSLLANEGCLYQCPFKLAHDSHISMINVDANVSIDTYEINRTCGCMKYLQNSPHSLFKSPFIRPEDVDNYADTIDIIKICGRTLGSNFLQNVVSAYIKKAYPGNLLKLMDTMEWMADRFYVANENLPDDFFHVMTTCLKVCSTCSYCSTLFDKHVRTLDFVLKDMSD